MAEMKKNYLTLEEKNEYEAELKDLIVNKRAEISQKIKEARELGDLSENAEYDAAKDEQRDVEARIAKLEKILANYEIIEDSGDSTTITMGCTVKIRDMELKQDMEYKIVGSTGANILKNRISNESPIGAALIGAKEGEIVKVETPSGLLKYKVLSFSK